MTQKRRRLSVEQRREELLEAATRIFSTTPYGDVSTQDLAKASGTSQGLLFHYFESKAGLYTAFLERHAHALFDATTPNSVEAALELYLERIAAAPFAWAAGKHGGEEPTEAMNLRILRRDEAVEKLCELLDSSDELAASGFLGFVDAICLDWVDNGCPAQQRSTIIAKSLAVLGALFD